MPEGLFTVGVAAALDPAMPWDVVICRSFAGRPEVDYIRGVVARMFAKATHGIALLNVPEQAHRALLHALAEVGAKAIQIEGMQSLRARLTLRFVDSSCRYCVITASGVTGAAILRPVKSLRDT